jgi:hypothetical protein
MKKAMKILPGNTFFERPTSIPGCDASGPGIVYPPRRKEAVFWNNRWKGDYSLKGLTSIEAMQAAAALRPHFRAESRS